MRDLVKAGVQRVPSALNAVRMIAVNHQMNTLATSDDRLKVYPELVNKKPHGQCDVMLIKGSFCDTT